jgi:uncharacterized protein (TIGR03083 family)
MSPLSTAGECATVDPLVHSIEGEQWKLPTPCTEWNVRDLVNHLVYEHLWTPHMVTGKTLDEVGHRFEGDVLGSDPQAAWGHATAGPRTPSEHRLRSKAGCIRR